MVARARGRCRRRRGTAAGVAPARGGCTVTRHPPPRRVTVHPTPPPAARTPTRTFGAPSPTAKRWRAPWVRVDPRLASWLARAHGAPTPAQAATVPRVEAGEHVLLSSPTGSGKTLAAFLGILSDLGAREPLEDRTYVVYVSPLRALVNDMAKSLAAPIAGAGLPVRVAVRTGDTPPGERQRQARLPPHILVTTPESLALLLASPKAREALRGLRYVVVDEVHAIAESKRGSQLALTLERLAAYAGEFQRIGLSATVSPVARVAAFLGGDRPVRAVEIAPRGAPELEVALVAPDPLALTSGQLEAAVLDLVEREMTRSRTLIVFTNTRASAERLTKRLQDRHPHDVVEADEGEVVAEDVGEGDEAFTEHALVMPHHGSMSKASRLLVEDRLKRAQVRCVVASSSLELGIHVEHVDRVLLLGSPKSAARALQRIGRSGHLPGATARATLVVTDPGDLAEAYALQALVRERRVEDVRVVERATDVLAQHLIALRHELPDADAFALTRRAWPYRDLTTEALADAFDVAPRTPRHVYLQNAGTIPEAGHLKVFCGETYVGSVEEAFAETLQEDDVFLLAGATWRFLRATPARVLVAPAKGGSPTVPAWRGEGISATTLLAENTEHIFRHGCSDTRLTEFVKLQERLVGDANVETFPTGEGRRALVVHAHLGRRANDALARALSWRHGDARAIASDAGFALVTARGWKPTKGALLRLLDAPLEATLREALHGSDLLKRRFRHVAARALLITRQDGETLGMRQRTASWLLARFPDTHPLVEEAMSECLHDALDLGTAERWRGRVLAGAIPLRFAPSRPFASPLAARILAPPGEGRHAMLRDNADAISYHMEKLS